MLMELEIFKHQQPNAIFNIQTSKIIIMGKALIVSIAILLLRLLGLGLGDPQLVLDDVTADQYSEFLTALRSQLRSATRDRWGFLVLPQASQVPIAQCFVQATLTSNEKSVTLGIDVTNLYLYAYRVSGKSYFFQDAPGFAKTYLFNGTQITTLPFKSDYGSLGGRENVNLGIHSLRNAVNALAKNLDKEKKKSLVVIIQMVCEAARFKYIEDKIGQSITDDEAILPESTIMKTIMELENNWGKLSTAVQNAENGQLKSAVKIGDKELQNVTEVKEYLAVMKNKNSVILRSCNNVNDQKWTLRDDGTIVSLGKRNRVGNNARQWRTAKDGTLIHNPSLVLMATEGAARTTLKVQKDLSAASQSWQPSVYSIPFRTSIVGLQDLCLTGRSEGARVWVEQCKGQNTEQRWSIYGDRTIRKSQDTNLCVTSGGHSSGVYIILRVCSGSANQRWVFRADGAILNPNAGMVMDVKNSDPSLLQIILYPFHDNPNQKWLQAF